MSSFLARSIFWSTPRFLAYRASAPILTCSSRVQARSSPISPLSILRTFAAMASPTVKLNSGHEMPLVGFGLWKVDNPVCAETVYQAIKAGYRLLDGACGTFHSPSPSSPSPLPSLYPFHTISCMYDLLPCKCASVFNGRSNNGDAETETRGGNTGRLSRRRGRDNHLDPCSSTPPSVAPRCPTIPRRAASKWLDRTPHIPAWPHRQSLLQAHSSDGYTPLGEIKGEQPNVGARFREKH